RGWQDQLLARGRRLGYPSWPRFFTTFCPMFTILGAPTGRIEAMVLREEKLLRHISFVNGRRMGRIAIGALAAALLAAAGCSIARAETFGQIGEAWGEAGTGPGQFHEPSLFGVDPSDGSVYAGDLTAGSPPTHYRVQKFSSTGEFEASAEISRWNND